VVNVTLLSLALLLDELPDEQAATTEAEVAIASAIGTNLSLRMFMSPA
jgi:hypothetical protein